MSIKLGVYEKYFKANCLINYDMLNKKKRQVLNNFIYK